MSAFKLPDDLMFNRARVEDPQGLARELGALSWLYLNGHEFDSMPGGMSYAQVQKAVEHSANVVTDPPRTFSLDLARQHVAALDDLPRPTLITCRGGPRASAVAYMYAGLRAGADADSVLAEAERADAPFCQFEDYKAWVKEAIEALGRARG